MKNKLLLALILLTLMTRVVAQDITSNKIVVKLNSVYTSIQPVDLGVGIRYDRYLKNFGTYSSISKGNYWFDRDHTNYIRDHIKITVGVSIYLPEYREAISDFTIGVNYHLWNNVNTNNVNINQNIFNPWSLELGVTNKVKRLAIGLRTDILRWEPCLDIGYNF
jgi:hypothetical protein